MNTILLQPTNDMIKAGIKELRENIKASTEDMSEEQLSDLVVFVWQAMRAEVPINCETMVVEKSTIDLSKWIKQEEVDFGENALLHPNTLYLTVLREINQQVNEFMGGSVHLLHLAKKYSVFYCQLSQEDRNDVAMILAFRSKRAGTKSISI
ncbi:hypothetical protein GZ353_004037 [Salmonella enterica]|uniref:hypothetical protein n=1 Tax=Citrobacter cronae TaxID=1748967 RepID=UPI001DE0D342|nr:hypothetical protein [Citrobacter cronae]EAX9402776.1 hypothetical protein [Salmonella enterica]EEG3323360.1 hypothetical protein [Salmonella enterica]